MAITCPPPPLGKEEFTRRWNAGARTMAELDPEFDKWIKETDRTRMFGAICLTIGCLLIAAMAILVTAMRVLHGG